MSIQVWQIDMKVEFMEKTLAAFYDRPDFRDNTLSVLKSMLSYLERSADKGAERGYKQCYSEKVNLLFNKQIKQIADVDENALFTLYHFISRTPEIEKVLRMDIGLIEVLTEEQKLRIVELMMQSASSKMPKNCSSLYSDCKCVSMFFKDTLGEVRTDMTPNDLYKYYIAHASHSMNPHNAVSLAAIVKSVDEMQYNLVDCDREKLIQTLHLGNQVLTGDSDLDFGLNQIIKGNLVKLPRIAA
ncbi:hypothetical protein RGL65_001200 [Vibrio parahaemolyticus]|nr:hypothetical protein [Vibrio parahaemolyticus]